MTVHTVLSECLAKWSALDFREVEVSLHLVYMLGEALPVSVGGHGLTTTTAVVESEIRELLSQGVISGARGYCRSHC